MHTDPLCSELSVDNESCEISAWQDLYAAAPADFTQAHGLAIGRIGNLVLTRCKTIPFTHFNCVLNLGLLAPATEEEIDELIRHYQQAGIKSFTIYHTPLCQPAQLGAWLESRGFQLKGGWDRIHRDARPMGSAPAISGVGRRVERVGPSTAAAWADFIDSTYGLPTKPWLMGLVERPGWHHYALWEEERIVAVRTMYVHHDGRAWLGIDAPVPGLMGPSFEQDAQLCHAMVGDGLALGVRHFVADIEAPTAAFDTPAYRHFAALGFQRAYLRRLLVRG